MECPLDPSKLEKLSHDRLQCVARRALDAARQTIQTACDEDERFAALVAASGALYEFVHRSSMGALLLATAGRSATCPGGEAPAFAAFAVATSARI
jgi:hypothetical protein